MPAYVVFTREKTRNADQLAKYKELTPQSFEQHPVKVLASHGRLETLEGPAAEDMLILQFETYEAAKTWYDSPAYKAACVHRFQGGDYRAILTEGHTQV
jgi:uncharacterized protein (DUF1330 family)